MAKKMQKLFAMLLIGTVTLSATSLSALAVDYDISSGTVYVETDESGTKSWQENHIIYNSKKTGSADKEITITQSNPKAATSNTVNVGENVRDVTITLDDVNIKANDRESAVTIGAGASANITISGKNTLVGGTNGAGIAVPGTAALTLGGEGTLTAIGNAGQNGTGSGAGIGGTESQGDSGTILIDGLKTKDEAGQTHGLTAEGYGIHASGIGSALDGSSGAITIKDSTIDKVNGGFKTNILEDPDFGGKDYEGGAAIGGGGKGGTCGDITIENSTISSAHGGSKATAIGGSCWADVGDITITDSTLNDVVGGSSSAGIGVGRVNQHSAGADANITIRNSTVNVTGGEYGAGIGTGYNGDSIGNQAATDWRKGAELASTTITIENSTVTAVGGNGGAGIGGGYKGWNTNVTITGGKVYAQGGVLDNKNVRTQNGASAIGTGANGSGQFEGGKITIDDTAQVIAVSNGGKWAIDLSCDVTGVAPAYQNMFLSLDSETTCSGEQSKNKVDDCVTVNYKNEDGYTVIMNGYTIVLPADFLCAAVTTGGAEGEFRTINEDGTWYFSHYGSVASAQKNYAGATTAEALGAVVLDMTVTGDLAANSYLHVALRPNSEVPPPVPTPGPGPGTDPGTDPDPDPGTDPDEDTPTIDIPDGDAPLTDIPTTDIPDEDVPLSDIPKTGDISALWLALAALSGSGLVGLSLTGKKRQEEQDD